MMPHDPQSHSEGSHVGDLVPGPWVHPEARPNSPAAQQPHTPAVPSTDVERAEPRQAGPTRVLRASQVVVGRARQLATSPTTRARTRRIKDALKDELVLIGQGVHMVCRRCTVEGQLRRYYEGQNPNGRVRPDMIDKYDKARAELLKYRDAHRAGRYARYGLAGTGVVAEIGWLASLVGLLPSGHVALDLTMLGINAAVALKLRSEGQRLRLETWGSVDGRPALEGGAHTTANDIAAILRDAGILPSSVSSAAEAGLALITPPTAVAGGWEVHVALPPGVVVSKVKKRLAELASALDTIPQKVSVSKLGESERRVAIRVWKELPLSGPGGVSPLVSAPKWDVTKGIPLGVDIDGERVSVDIVKALHGLMCAGTGGGKTASARLFALAFVLDPTADLHILDGKPDGAWAAYAPHCGEYVEVQEAGDLERAAVALERLVDDMRDRMARKARGEKLPFSLIILDEFQEITGKLSGAGMGADSPKARARAALDTLARRARSANMRLLLATQQFDGQTLDAGVEANLMWRWCGSVPTSDMSRATLGPRVAALGLDASRDLVAGDQVGVGYLVAPGLGSTPPLVKSDFASDEDVAEVCARVLAEKGGTASAPVVDEHQERDHADEVIDVEIDREADLMEALASWLVAEHVADDTEIPSGQLWKRVVEPYAESVWPDGDRPSYARSIRGFGDWLAKNGVPKIEGKTPKRRAGDIYEAAARMVGGNVTGDDDQQFPGELRAVR